MADAETWLTSGAAEAGGGGDAEHPHVTVCMEVRHNGYIIGGAAIVLIKRCGLQARKHARKHAPPHKVTCCLRKRFVVDELVHCVSMSGVLGMWGVKAAAGWHLKQAVHSSSVPASKPALEKHVEDEHVTCSNVAPRSHA